MARTNPPGDQRSNYGFLNTIGDPDVKKALKVILDRLGDIETRTGSIGTLTRPLLSDLDAAGRALKSIADPTDDLDAVNLKTLRDYVEAAIAANVIAPVTEPTPTPTPAPGTPAQPVPVPAHQGVCYTSIATGQPGGVPAAPNLRWFRGDFCGVDVPGLPAVAGGASSPTVVFSPFIDRYSPTNQATIVAAHKALGYTHFILSWADSRDGAGQSIAQFVATAQMLSANGLYPVVMLYSKDYDGVNPDPAKNDALIAALIAGGVAVSVCVGWELNLFVDPGATIQALIDHVTGLLVPSGTLCYVHFSQGYVAWQAPGTLASSFWAANVGKLRGIFHQKDLSWDCALYQSRLSDLQVRFGSGVAGWPVASGFGHPFDIVAYEYAAEYRFNGSMTMAQAQAIGQQAIASPAPGGGAPVLAVSGFCNGGPHV